jgi:chemotaxis protein MotB
MARQRIHNRRAARGSVGGGASWISYSDMMAALLLIFVLILSFSLSHSFSMLEAKDKELNQSLSDLAKKDLLLRQALHELGHSEQELNLKTQELDQTKIELDQKVLLLDALQIELNDKEYQLSLSQSELEAAQLLLAQQQQKLDAQQQALSTQAGRIDALIGIRKTMITDLSATLARSGIDAKVDESGNIVLNSSVFFESNKSTILPEGQALLNRFIPVYLGVLLQDKYADYLGEIIIEGHTDSTGTYEKNLKLSQDRALQVALYCLEMPSLTPQQKAKLQQIMTARGRSYSDPVYDAYGMEDKDASRRVEFKFRLKDAEMMEELIRILSSD